MDMLKTPTQGLHIPLSVKVTIQGFVLNVDYRRLTPPVKKDPTPILLFCGWGSGWEGIVPLACALMREGYEVLLFSLPGYGSSDDLPKPLVNENVLDYLALAVNEILQNLAIVQGYLIGHSMAAIILMKAVARDADLVSRLILLNPAGMRKYCSLWSRIGLAARFIISGLMLRIKYAGKNHHHHELVSWCGRQKSPFCGSRFEQRVMEFVALCTAQLPKVFVPVEIVAGRCDIVFLPIDMPTGSTLLPGVPHNSVLYNAEEVAAEISRLLEINH